MVSGLLKVEPNERLTIPEILSHPWLRDFPEEDEEWDNNESEDDKCAKQADINRVRVANLYFRKTRKLSYVDYCYIANDFYTQHIGIEIED